MYLWFFSLIVLVYVFTFFNKKFNKLNHEIKDLQDQLNRLSEQSTVNQSTVDQSCADQSIAEQNQPKTHIDDDDLQTINHNNSYSQVLNQHRTKDTLQDSNYQNQTSITEQPLESAPSLKPDHENSQSLTALGKTSITTNPSQSSEPLSTTSATYQTPSITDTAQQAETVSVADPKTKLNHPSEPDEQSIPIVTSVAHSLKNWFFGGNLVVRVGAIVLLMGVILLLRLISEYIETPIEVKLIVIGAIGLAMAGLGLKLVHKRFTYGITLQGAGLAIAYLSTFFAYQVYDVLSSLPSFITLAILSALTVFLAVRQNAFPLALLAFSGAFLAPLLTSNNSGTLTVLFGYYLLLNVAIAIIANYRTWKVLNLLAATVTFGFAYYLGLIDIYITRVANLDAQRWSLVAMVTLHWLLYVFVVIRYTQQLLKYNKQITEDNYARQTNTDKAATGTNRVLDTGIQSSTFNSQATLPKTTDTKQSSRFRSVKDKHTALIIPVDVGLLFGVPLLAFGIMSALLNDIEHALTIASAVMSGVYLTLGAFFVVKQKRSIRTNSHQDRYRPLVEGMLALGFGFFALTIAIAFDAQWTACGWSIQGLALIWFGRYSLRAWTVLLGVLLQALAIASLLSVFDYYYAPSPSNLSLSISALCCLASVFILRHENAPTVSKYQQSPQAQHLLSNVNTNNLAFKMIWSNPMLVGTLSFISVIWVLIVSGIIVDDYMGNLYSTSAELLACILLFNLTIYLTIDHYRKWNNIRVLNHGLMYLFYLALIFTLYINFEYFDQQNSAFWPVVFILLAGWLIVGQLWLKRWHQNNQASVYNHIGWLMTGSIVAAQFAHYLLPNSNGVMTVIITGLLLVTLSLMLKMQKLTFPAWFNWSAAILGCAWLFVPLLVGWAIYSNWMYDGVVWGLRYIPIFNLYDGSVVIILVYLISTFFVKTSDSSGDTHKPAKNSKLLIKIAGLVAFWMLSSLIIRTLHAYANTPLWYNGAWYNEQVQTALTIFWTLIALVATIISSRYRKRFWWFMGIGLLGVVVLKLVVVDLSQTDAIWRVISFIAAGSLILLIGYFTPLPPEQTTKLEKDT